VKLARPSTANTHQLLEQLEGTAAYKIFDSLKKVCVGIRSLITTV
jgi:hypothetical protein